MEFRIKLQSMGWCVKSWVLPTEIHNPLQCDQWGKAHVRGYRSRNTSFSNRVPARPSGREREFSKVWLLTLLSCTQHNTVYSGMDVTGILVPSMNIVPPPPAVSTVMWKSQTVTEWLIKSFLLHFFY